ncbi:MAG: hypothetical protein Q8W44_03265 [Candidatus Palauibacterales bacterium]|nr:hypothetical protein [Candidatus Palauibacterales bacterium]
MIDSAVLVPTMVVGSLLALWYLVQVTRRGRGFDGNRLFVVVYYAAGISIGVLLAVEHLAPQALPFSLGRWSDLYIAFAGVWVLASSGLGVYRDLYLWPERVR